MGILTKAKNFCSTKDNGKKKRRQATQSKQTFSKDRSDQGLLSKTYKEHKKLNLKNLILKWLQNCHKYLTKDNIQVANKQRKRRSIILIHVIREMKIATTMMRHNYTPATMAKFWNNTKYWRECRATRTLIHCWWKGKLVQPL